MLIRADWTNSAQNCYGPLRAPHALAPATEGVMTHDRPDWEERRIQVLKQEIAERLRLVCERVPNDEFDILVERMARVQHKYQQQRSEEFFSTTRDPDPRRPAK